MPLFSVARFLACLVLAKGEMKGVPSRGRPEVVRSILGEVDQIGRWVGTLAEPRIRNRAVLHDVTVHRDEQSGFLFARVQYLTAIGSPIYGVILGKLDEPFVESDYVPQPPHQITRECRWASHAAPFDLSESRDENPKGASRTSR
jgi:hypothetical protein